MGAQMRITNMLKNNKLQYALLCGGKKGSVRGCPTMTTFLVDEGDRGSKYIEQRAIIGPQGKLHFKGVPLQGR